jgi:NADH-quinone oxidoreductase subunit E
MLRRLHPQQPDSFVFTEANQAWAEAQIAKFPEGRQASAIIPLLMRAQEQEGWLTRPAIEHVSDMLGLAHIRGLEVATFYFMFQLQPVGTAAHLQICGTTPCMLCGAEDLIAVCKEKIAPRPHQRSADGKLSWEEVECLGACANAPMAQIGKDYYEDLTAEGLAALIDRMAAGEVPRPGSQAGRFASEPATGLTALETDDRAEHNGSVALATAIGDTLKRIDGTEVPLRTPWRKPEADGAEAPERDTNLQPGGLPSDDPTPGPKPAADEAPDDTGITKQAAAVEPSPAKPEEGAVAEAADGGETDPRVGRQVGVGKEPTVGETKPEGAGAVAEGQTGRDVPEGQEARGGVRAGNVATSEDEARHDREG